MGPRHQLAAYSPVSAFDLAASLLADHSASEQLAAMLARKYEASDATLTGSGTHALQLALDAGRRPGGRALVAAPGFSCYDIATAVIGAGTDVVLYDIDPATLGPDFDSLRRAVSHGPTAVILSPLYGVPFDWDTAVNIVRGSGAIVVEDAAQGHGASWRRNPFGSLGDLSVLSFSRGKGWTGGAGGAALSRNGTHLGKPANAAPASSPRIAAMLALQLALGRPALYGIPRSMPGLGLGETTYHEPTAIRPMSAISAAMILRSRERADLEAATRKRNASILAGMIPASIGQVVPHSDGEAGYLRFPILPRAGMKSFGEPARAERLGVAASYPIPLEELAPLGGRLLTRDRLPGAVELSRRLVTLPTHSMLSSGDLDQIGAALSRV